MRSGPARFLWLPLVLLLLVPVVRHAAVHHHEGGAGTGRWVLLTGMSSLDSLLAAARGKPALLNFWATWCSPCVRELPLLEMAAESSRGDAAVFTISIGDPSVDDVRRFLEAEALDLTVVWLDAEDAARAVARFALPDAVPVTIVLDPGGVELARAVGARDYSWFAGQLSSAGGPPRDSLGVPETGGLHVNVVGSRRDSLALALEAEALRLAGPGGVSFFDPSVPADSAAAAALFLPLEGLPYAQPCVGDACGRPVRSPGDLEAAVGQLAGP